MKATELYAKKRLIYGTENDFKTIMEDSIISHSNGLASKTVPNLIIMTDSKDNFHQNLLEKQSCSSRGMFQCTRNSDENSKVKNPHTECYNFLQICDQVCDCTEG